ncbi:hypothetical protein JHD50_12020 [Sulfurimonas sp. MAG313]|nr:hypothetical protein [Sulfurimonas sp. MAG313]MDF1882016.1 hypothetical protein [Sulfurimonas sp. MAG313]
MKKLFIAVLILTLVNTIAFAAKTLTEKNISKMLDQVIIAKEHKNIKSMRKHFLSRTSINLTHQDIDVAKTYRFTFNEYKRHLSKKWKQVQSNLIKVTDRKFNIDKNGKSALVKTTLTQTIEIEGIKMQTTVYETTAISLIKGKIYINYYSARKMLNTSVKVN